jgi:hypothetical protein
MQRGSAVQTPDDVMDELSIPHPVKGKRIKI